jgi:hypothetical protein
MNTGTLSTQRGLTDETVIDPTMIKTEEAPAVIDPIRLPEPEPNLNPTLNLPVPTEHLKDKNCRFCSASAIANLSFRFALVVFVIALSISVLKSGGTKNV